MGDQSLLSLSAKFFDVLGHPAFIMDAEQSIVAANSAAETAASAAAGALNGRKCYDVMHGLRESGPPPRCPFVSLLRSGRLETQEMPVEVLGGTYFVSCTPILDADARVLGAFHIAADITLQKNAQARTEAALKEKEIMLREIHHRVRNNLQVVSSLLRLHSRTFDDPAVREKFQDSHNRIRAVALIHELLYASKAMSSLDFSAFVERQAAQLLELYGREGAGVQVRVEIGEEAMDLNRAVPCALIITELLSNAISHAYPEGRGGRVVVSLDRGPAGRWVLRVRDDGIGLPETVNPYKAETIGLQIVSELTRQLNGRFEVNRGAGTEFRIEF